MFLLYSFECSINVSQQYFLSLASRTDTNVENGLPTQDKVSPIQNSSEDSISRIEVGNTQQTGSNYNTFPNGTTRSDSPKFDDILPTNHKGTSKKVASFFRNIPSRAFTRKQLNRKLPITEWLPKYTGSFAVSDVIAGITVGLTVIPQGIAYAGVAELPAQVYRSNFVLIMKICKV